MKRFFLKPICMTLAIALVFTLLQTSRIISAAGARAADLAAVSSDIGITLSDWVLDETNGYIYAISQASNKLVFIRTDTLKITKSISFDASPTDIKLFSNSIWIPIQKSRQVVRIDVASQSIVDTYRLQNEPVKIELYQNTLFYTKATIKPNSDDWTSVYAYHLMTGAETQITDKAVRPELAVDREHGVLYLSEKIFFYDKYLVHSYSADDYRLTDGDNFSIPENYIQDRAPKMIYDGKNVYFAGKAFDPGNIKVINGTYGYSNYIGYDDKNGVYFVSGRYVFTNDAVFDRDTYAKLADLPFETTLSLMDSRENVYLFDPSAKTLVKEQMDLSHMMTSRNTPIPGGIQLENSPLGWVYDPDADMIYAITQDSQSILFINAKTMTVEGEKLIGSIPSDIQLSDGKLYVALFGATKIAVTGTALSSPVETITAKIVPYRIAVDGDKLYYASRDGNCDLYVYNFKTSTHTKLGSYGEPDMAVDKINHILYIASGNLQAISTVDDSIISWAAGGSGPGGIIMDGSDFYSSGYRFNNVSMSTSIGRPLGFYNTIIYAVSGKYVLGIDGVYDRDSYKKIISWYRTYPTPVLVGKDGAAYFFYWRSRTLVKYDGVESYAASLTVSGEKEIAIPGSGTVTSDYSAFVLDQYRNPISKTTAWSLAQPVDGVTINPTTGRVTVSSTASSGNVVIKAVSGNSAGVFTLNLLKSSVGDRRAVLSGLVDKGTAYLNTVRSWPWMNTDKLKSAVAAAKTVLNKSSATLAEISTAVKALEAQVNRTYLEDLSNRAAAEAEHQSSYIYDRLQVLLMTGTEGHDVYFNADSPTNEVRDAIAKLNFALYTLPAFDTLTGFAEKIMAANTAAPKTQDVLQSAITQAHALQLSPYWKYAEIGSATEKIQNAIQLVYLDQYVAWGNDLLDRGSASFSNTVWNGLNAAYTAAVSIQTKADATAYDVRGANDLLGTAVVTAEIYLITNGSTGPKAINCSDDDWSDYQNALKSTSDLLVNSAATPDQSHVVLKNLADALKTIFTHAPGGLTAVASSSAASNDAQIFGTSVLMEYRLTSDTTWTMAAEKAVTVLPAGTYNVRYSAATGFAAGAATTIIVRASDSPNPITVKFDDVPDDQWYSEAVNFAAARGITNGTSPNHFSPDMVLTRGQFVVMLMRAYGIDPDQNPADNFTDAGHTYYTNYLTAAKRLDIAKGVGNNMFIPDGALSRQDMLTMLYRALKTLGKLPDTHSTNTLSDYNDASKISDYAHEAMDSMVKLGVVTGSNGMLNPFDVTNRAQMTQVFYRLLST